MPQCAGERGREREKERERERESWLWLFYLYVYLSLGLSCVNWASQECLFRLRSSLRSSDLLLFHFRGLFPALSVATAILDSFSLFYLPDSSMVISFGSWQKPVRGLYRHANAKRHPMSPLGTGQKWAKCVDQTLISQSNFSVSLTIS